MPGLQIDRRCGSGLQAVLYAARQVGHRRGRGWSSPAVPSRCPNVEHYALGLRTGVRQGGVAVVDRLDRARETAGGADHPVPGGMIETAENLRREYGITREAQDELAVRSHHRAVAAHEAGRFADELVPVTCRAGAASPTPSSTATSTPGPTPPSRASARCGRSGVKVDPDSTVTAGNASGQNDGAAVCVVTTRAEAERRGLTPLLPLRSWAVTGVRAGGDGHRSGRRDRGRSDRAGLTLDDIDLIELNEAFAAQVLAVLTRVEASTRPTTGSTRTDRASRSATRSGRPARGSWPRWRTRPRRDARYVLETMCIGGGQGLAAVFERVA